MPAELAAIPAVASVPVTAHAVAAQVAVPVWLELIAIVVSSVSGALTAREKNLDLVGAVCLAALCSLGGGLLRDATLQVGNVYILNQPAALPAAIITAAVVFAIPTVIAKQDRLIAVFDIFAVGLYAATGADKALVYGFSPIICVTMDSLPEWAAACCATSFWDRSRTSLGAATFTPLPPSRVRAPTLPSRAPVSRTLSP